MKLSRKLYVYWPVGLFLHTAVTACYYMPNILVGHSPHIHMSNPDRLIASSWIVAPVALTIRAAREIRS